MNKISLYFLRHGVAAAKGSAKYKDSERPLTSAGIKEVKKVAKSLKCGGFKPDLILTSPYIRAAKTAEITADILKIKKRFGYSLNLVPSGDFRKLFTELKKQTPKNPKILLVGHEPHLSGFVSRLVFGQTSGRLVLKKAGLCKVVFESGFKAGEGALAWLLTPSQILRMAGD